jgi:outer membrane protein assembly factor BamD (BamD/ComL family)
MDLECKNMRKKGVILLAVLGLAFLCFAETWHLGSDQNWKKVSEQGNSDNAFMVAVAQAKQHVSSGDTAKAKRAYDKLKKDYPELAGGDFDAYVKGELLYSKRKYAEASQAYESFLDQYPKSLFFRSAMERQQQIATAFLGGQKRPILKVFKVSAYEEGAEISNKIADRAGDAPAAKRALQILAQSREKRGAYEEAYQAWADASNRWPTGEMGQESLMGMARSLELAYKGPKFDGKVLASSKSYYAEYLKRYPESAQQLNLSEKIIKLDEKLGEKELLIADYYARTGSTNAADIYYQQIIDDWPATSAAKTSVEKQPGIKKELERLAQPSSKKRKMNWKGLFL